MPKLTLQLLLGVLAVAMLAVGPSAASDDPRPTAKSAGNGGGYGCDHYPPHSRYGDDWWGRDGDGRYWNGYGDDNGYFDGRSYDRGCPGSGARASARGRVARVMVAVKRLRDGRCQHLNRSGNLSSRGSCGHTHWMRAKGKGRWSFQVPKGLPRGRYRLHARAVDRAGNRERTRLLHLRIR